MRGLPFTSTRRRLVLVLSLSVVACAGDPPRRAAALDPSNAANGESASPPATAEATAPRPAEDHASHVHGGRSAPSAVYACPMHPEVRQPGPGRCPKCGMTLVPVEAGTSASTTMPHHHTTDGGS